MPDKIICITSGGLDSTCMALQYQTHYHVIPLYFYYGSKHNHQERESARAIFQEQLKEINIDLSFLQNSSLINPQIPIAQSPYNTPKVLSSTVVPNRNMIMIAYAVAWAEQEGAKAVALGNHSADHAVYADCRPAFISALNESVRLSTEGRVELWSPFQHKNKAELLAETIQNIPACLPRLWQTYSCYKGRPRHCGICPTCRERKSAFQGANLEDRTHYTV